MRKVRPKIFATILIIFCVWFTACESNRVNSSNNRKQLTEIAQFLGVEFPVDAKIIHAGKNDRSNELAYFHIIYTRMPVKFKEPPVAKITAENSINNLKKFSHAKKPGKLTDKWKYCYEGKVKDGEWSAYQTNFDNGSYLEVEQFYF